MKECYANKKTLEIPLYKGKTNVFSVGMTGLEPATSRPPDACANQLRYIPYFLKASAKLALKIETAKFICNFFTVCIEICCIF